MLFKKTLFAICFLGMAVSPARSVPVVDPIQAQSIANILVVMTLQLMKIREILAQEQMQVSAIGRADEAVVSSAQRIYEDADDRPDIAQLTWPSTASDLQGSVGGKDTKTSVQEVFQKSYIRPETEELLLQETGEDVEKRRQKLNALFINSVASSYASSVAYLSEAERTRANEYDPLKILASNTGKTLKGKTDAVAAILVAQAREIREGNKLLAEFIRLWSLKAATDLPE